MRLQSAAQLSRLPTAPTPGGDVADALARARRAQAVWAATPLRHRLTVLRRLRREIAAHGAELAATLDGPNRPRATSLLAEVLPLADAVRFLERYAPRALKPVRHGRRGLPLWLTGLGLEVRREPFGVILVVAPSNYPLFLPGVQAVQALAAGNAVAVKPAPGWERPVEMLRDLAAAAGLDRDLFPVLAGGPEAVRAALAAGVDKVVLTGSAETGQAVLGGLVDCLVPAAMELSGCDAVFVRPDADLDLLARALTFSLGLNGGATCIAPRRVFVPRHLLNDLETRLAPLASSLPPAAVPDRIAGQFNGLVAEAVERGARSLAGGAGTDGVTNTPAGRTAVRPTVLTNVPPAAKLLTQDVFAPVLSLIPVADDEEAVALNAACPYALGASVFGKGDGAMALARRIDAGAVTVNDVVAPTADPRVPFGGRRRSGFGVTRGLDGLLEMTCVKAISSRTGRFRPHYELPRPGDDGVYLNYLRAAHGRSPGRRLAAALGLMRALTKRPPPGGPNS